MAVFRARGGIACGLRVVSSSSSYNPRGKRPCQDFLPSAVGRQAYFQFSLVGLTEWTVSSCCAPSLVWRSPFAVLVSASVQTNRDTAPS